MIRHVDAGDEGLTINPADFDRIIAMHRAMSEADKSLARIIDEVAQEADDNRETNSLVPRNPFTAGLVDLCECNLPRGLALAPMPRFYFDVREGVRFTPDDEGIEFPNIDAAEREAAEAAAAIGRDLLPKGFARSVTVEVRNEHSQRVATATVTLALDRVDPEPSRQGATFAGRWRCHIQTKTLPAFDHG
jgi:hypothetical protein